MAKRKRLEIPEDAFSAGSETKSAFPAPPPRAPIASVAGDTAARAALDEISAELATAEREGRLVKRVPIDRIDTEHMARDRMVLDEAEMMALIDSLRERGQQHPVEVVTLDGGRYGLISGLRRIEALRLLGEQHVLAVVRRPESSQDAYVAMIEENEIRVGLSFYERANIVAMAVEIGLFPTASEAVKALFARAPAPKRSKILNFVLVRDRIGAVLRFPYEIPEKLGLALASAIEADPRFTRRVVEALDAAKPADAQAERRVLDAVLKTPAPGAATAERVAPGIVLKAGRRRAVLEGKGVDAALLDDLRAWLAAR